MTSEAKRRAEVVLLRHLSFWEALTWRCFGCLYVKGEYSGDWYRIRKRVFDHQWCSVTRLCGSPFASPVFERYCVMTLGIPEGFGSVPQLWSALDETIPQADDALAKKLLLETNERLFRGLAVRM